MILNASFYNLLIFAIALAIGFLLFLLLKPMLKNRKGLRILLCLVMFMISWIVLYNTGTDVVVVRKNSETYFVLIGTDQLAIDGKTYKLKQEIMEGFEMDGKQFIPNSVTDYSKFIINKTGKPLVFESITYGTSSFPAIKFNNVDLFPADEVKGVSDFPDYFPSQVPPRSISVTKGIEYDREEWLRFAKQDEISDAGMQETMKHLREAGRPLEGGY